jgi:hypothetical protein
MKRRRQRSYPLRRIRNPASDDDSYIVTARYTAGGKEYTNVLDSYSPSYKEGGTVEVRYDPADPNNITSGYGIGVYAMAVGAVILLAIIFLTVRQKKSVNKLKESQGEIQYLPSEKGEETRVVLYHRSRKRLNLAIA